MVSSPSFPNKRPKAGTLAEAYITTAEVARRTGFTVRALEALRHRRSGPPFIKVG